MEKEKSKREGKQEEERGRKGYRDGRAMRTRFIKKTFILIKYKKA